MNRENILKKYSILAKKSLGQNFLVDEEKIQKIADIISIDGENILEVGPGYGALSQKILEKKPQSLHLVELDREMIEILEDRVRNGELGTQSIDFQIFYQDILKFEPNFGNLEYSVIANIPYYITSPILRHFLYDIQNTPESMVIMMQKDVADKIIGGKKDKTSVLRLFIEKKSYVSEKLFVPKESFFPIPKVESSVLLFEQHDIYDTIDDSKFLELIKKGFSEPRKKVIKNLVKGGYNEDSIRIFFTQKSYSENMRAEDMGIEDWIKLSEIL